MIKQLKDPTQLSLWLEKISFLQIAKRKHNDKSSKSKLDKPRLRAVVAKQSSYNKRQTISVTFFFP